MCPHGARHQPRRPAHRTGAVLRRSLQCLPRDAHGIRGFDDFALLRSLHACRDGPRARHGGAAAPLSQHVSDVHVHDAARAHDEQHGTLVGGDGGGDALDRAARDAVSHAGESRGRLEVLHPVRRRHSPGALWHDPPLFRRGTGARRRGRHGAPVDASRCGEITARALGARPRVRVPARWLRHEGRTRAAPQLAAGRSCRGSDADLRRALGTAPQRRDLRGRALQGARRGCLPLPAPLEDADGLRAPVRRSRRVLSLPATRHQAPLRLLVDRAHGDHYLCVRDGWTDCDLCGTAAHDSALAHEVLDLLHRRTRRAEGRFPAHGQHPRAHHALADCWLGAHARRACNPGAAALRRVRERVSDHHDGDARTALGHADPAHRARRCVRSDLWTRSADGLRRDRRAAAAAPAGVAAGICTPRHRARLGPLRAAVPRPLVPGSRALHRRTLIVPARTWWTQAREVPGAPKARGLAVTREEWTRVAQDVAATGGRLLSLWAARGEDAPSSAAIYAAYWIEAGLLLTELAIASEDGGARYPGLETLFPAASRMQRAASDLYGVRSTDPDQRPWLHHERAGYDFVRVEGEGVHEIAVGPVHAGTIEPGHFRFSVVGEKVLRLEERFGYAHKGIERRFTELPILEGH